LFLFIRILDCYQVLSAFHNLRDSSSKLSQYFSIFPGISPVVVTILWNIQCLNISLLILAISFATTFTGCSAFYIDACLEILANRVDEKISSNSNDDLRTSISQFRNLHYISREINKRMGLGLLLFYFILERPKHIAYFDLFEKEWSCRILSFSLQIYL
jgi:hypothetical protein